MVLGINSQTIMYLKIGIIFVCFLTIITCLQTNHPSPSPLVKEGEIYLTLDQFQNHKTITLSGDWEFVWDYFVSHQSLQSNTNDPITKKLEVIHPNAKKQYLAIGKRWKEIEKGTGFATYQLKLIFPEEEKEKLYAVRFLQTGGAAMRVFVDGKIRLDLGNIGETKESMIPTRQAGILLIPNPNKEVFITVQISNFYHDDGAFWYAPKLGRYEDIQNELSREMAFDSLLTGALLFMSFYHLVLFFFRRTKQLILYFGLFCITTALHSISLNGDILYFLYPTIPYRFAFCLSLIFYLAMPFYLFFLKELFPHQFSKRLVQTYSFICLLLYAIVVFAPTEIGSQTTFFGLFLTILGLFFSVFALLKSVLNKEGLAVGLFWIQIFLLITAINDTLFLYGLVHTALVLKYSYLTTVLFQSLLLASFFAKTFIKNETLRNELVSLNDSLERTVTIRTKEFKEAKQIAEEANQWKDKFISLVAHDLRSPLSTVYSALTIVDDEETLKEEKSHLLKQIFVILENAMSTIEHLLNLNRFKVEKGSIHLQISKIYVLESLNQLLESFQFEVQKKNLEIEFLVTKENYIYADLSILNEILRNLFANAIKFSFPNGKINIEFHESDTTTYLSFVDFGKGIPGNRIQNLFTESMSSPGTLGEKGFGIGLKLCYELMRLHQGNIQVESKPNEGSRFILEFPKP